MRRTLSLLLAFSALAVAGCSAASHGFDSAVGGVERRYSVHARRIPLMGLISVCARVYTHGGVKEMRVAEFEGLRHVDPAELFSLVQAKLGEDWQPIVKQHALGHAEGDANLSVVFARPAGRAMQLLVADYGHGELSMVRMGIDGASLSKWIDAREHGEGAAGSRYVSGE